jgi:enoyl-CoA hydratase
MPVSYRNIRLETPEEGIYVLTINRPKVLNALNSATIAELDEAIRQVRRDTEARVLLVTGAGDKAFVAGADISEMQGMSSLAAKDFGQRGLTVFRSLENLPVPVIAVVNGYALGGGCELAMSCDWILAADHAVFGQPEVNLGIPPGFGGTQRLLRLVGRGTAMEILITGRQVKAEEALRIGLATKVYPQQQLMAEALAVARVIRTKGPIAVRLAKEVVQRGQDLDLENACVLESEVFGLAFSTEDQSEGMAAFLERRPAVFRNR